MKYFSLILLMMFMFSTGHSQSYSKEFEEGFYKNIQNDSTTLASINLLDSQLTKLTKWYYAGIYFHHVDSALSSANRIAIRNFQLGSLSSEDGHLYHRAVDVADKYLKMVKQGVEEQYVVTLTELDYYNRLNDYGFIMNQLEMWDNAVPKLQLVIKKDRTKKKAILNLADALYEIESRDQKDHSESSHYYERYKKRMENIEHEESVPPRVDERIIPE